MYHKCLPIWYLLTVFCSGFLIFLDITATYTSYIIGQLKQAFPQLHSSADAGKLIAGPIGRDVMAVSQILIQVFIMATRVLSFSIAMDVLTGQSLLGLVWILRVGRMLYVRLASDDEDGVAFVDV